jgi:hypothetical protein
MPIFSQLPAEQPTALKNDGKDWVVLEGFRIRGIGIVQNVDLGGNARCVSGEDLGAVWLAFLKKTGEV